MPTARSLAAHDFVYWQLLVRWLLMISFFAICSFVDCSWKILLAQLPSNHSTFSTGYRVTVNGQCCCGVICSLLRAGSVCPTRAPAAPAALNYCHSGTRTGTVTTVAHGRALLPQWYAGGHCYHNGTLAGTVTTMVRCWHCYHNGTLVGTVTTMVRGRALLPQWYAGGHCYHNGTLASTLAIVVRGRALLPHWYVGGHSTTVPTGAHEHCCHSGTRALFAQWHSGTLATVAHWPLLLMERHTWHYLIQRHAMAYTYLTHRLIHPAPCPPHSWGVSVSLVHWRDELWEMTMHYRPAQTRYY